MSISISDAKAKAKRVRARLTDIGAAPVTQAQALELVAAVYGDTTWAAMRARLLNSTPVEDVLSSAPAAQTKKLRLYTVAMYARNEEGAEEFVEKKSVVSYSKFEAEDFMFETFFPAGRFHSGDA